MRIAIAVALILTLMPSAPAAPLPEAPALSDKYLLDDADMLTVINVKQVLASASFKKPYEAKVADLLKQDAVASLLKDAGFNPLKDVDRLYLMTGRSAYAEGKPGPGPVLLIQGRFDADKLRTAADKLVDAGKLKSQARGDARIYELAMGEEAFFAAVLDKNNVALTISKSALETALDKAAGKKTALKNKAVAEMFSKLKATDSAAFLATGDTVVSGHVAVTRNADGTVEKKHFVHTLGESGFQAMHVALEVGDTVMVKATLTAKDAAIAAKMEENVKAGIKQGIELLEKMREYPALLKVMKAVKVAVKDQTFTLQAEGDGEAVQQFVIAWLVPRPSIKPERDTNKP
jgi:hypothetical protein